MRFKFRQQRIALSRARYPAPQSASRETQSMTIRADQAKSSRKFEKSS
jgi:hypothetical protein